MTNGWGSREKSRLAVKRIPHVPKSEESPLALGATVGQSDEEEIVDAKPLAVTGGMPQIAAAPKRSIVRLDIDFSLIVIVSLLVKFSILSLENI